MPYHQFRKFFISQLSLIVSKEIAEMLAGHSGYLTGAYRRYTKKQLAEEYLKGQHLLTIQTPKELQEIESEFKAKMQSHSEIIEDLVKEKIALKQQIVANHDEFKREIEELRFIFENMYLIGDVIEGLLKTGSDETKRVLVSELKAASQKHPLKNSHGPHLMIDIPKELDWREQSD